MLHLNRDNYFLTEFSGDWASEAHVKEQPLEFGKKTIDTKLGARANMFCSPFFQLSLDGKSEENQGEVLVGTLGWTGNFSFVFEVDNKNELRVISGINPYASEYSLKPNEIFRTPDFYFTYSFTGKGQASRNFHDWARKYQVKDGNQTRMTLLNNWEATYFDFDEAKLVKLMDDAVELGVDMFLLDDGWFANKYPRSGDHQGLGDWDETADKLPHGVGYLTEAAKKKGIKFGIWIEPEMVNPKSELYEKHKDWVIHLPNRDEYYFRNQLVLDLSNPKVQDYVFGVVDNLMTKYPDIAFFKWDCNSPITNIYSVYLKNKQSHLYIDYVRYDPDRLGTRKLERGTRRHGGQHLHQGQLLYRHPLGPYELPRTRTHRQPPATAQTGSERFGQRLLRHGLLKDNLVLRSGQQLRHPHLRPHGRQQRLAHRIGSHTELRHRAGSTGQRTLRRSEPAGQDAESACGRLQRELPSDLADILQPG